jgi:anaerobic magnesium-protoporphyrin IX monomethyl ester cyclase
MRVALLYPPPWKIPAKGEAPATQGEGPPAEYREGDLDGDFFQTPYGLFALGAEALRAGHQVKVHNLSAFSWTYVQEIIRALTADVYGLSCWTANRRGVALVAREIKRVHPRAHVVVGGPHATPLAREMLEHHAEIDTIAVGESEATFLELLSRLSKGESAAGIPGTVFRQNGRVVMAPDRHAIEDLDALASVHDWFDTHIVMTSRGCAWRCTFCGAEASWGRGYRGQSTPYVLDALEKAVARAPVKMLQIKDDTFTTNKKRVLALCRGIRERGIRFLWSCDTRVDVLSDELLREMRLAGCERLSLGVESGSQRILDAIDKKITPDEIIASSELAKKYGIKLRYYMMIGNRGETRETFAETLAFLERAKPHQSIFACLSVYPGTRDYDAAVKAGWLDAEFYFERDFQELKTTFDASDADTAFFRDWFQRNKGLKEGYRETAAECAAVVERLGEHAPAYMDLAGALFREGRLDEAEANAERALALEYPAPGLALNTLACIAARRGQAALARKHIANAVTRDPQHWVVVRNQRLLAQWDAQGGGDALPELASGHDFQLLERPAQPTLPGPLPKDFAEWQPPPAPPARPVGSSRPAEARKLRVVSA